MSLKRSVCSQAHHSVGSLASPIARDARASQEILRSLIEVYPFKSRVFEKFAQADASDANQLGGTGLGLSIVKQIVPRLGGEIGFDDAPGGGAIFNVDVPVWSGDAETNSSEVL